MVIGRVCQSNVQKSHHHHHPEIKTKRIEPVSLYELPEGRLTSDESFEGENRAAVIRIVLNVGADYQNEARLDCGEPINNSNLHSRCLAAQSSDSSSKNSEELQHKTSNKAICGGRHQLRRSSDGRQIRQQLSSIGLLNYERNIVRTPNVNPSGDCDTVRCCETCTKNIACCSDTTRNRCLERSPAVLQLVSDGTDVKRGNLIGREATLCGRHLEHAIIDSGACACHLSKAIFDSSNVGQVSDTCLLTGGNGDTSYFCPSRNSTADIFKNLDLVEKRDRSLATSANGSLLFKEHQTASQIPYVTTINLTSKPNRKEDFDLHREDKSQTPSPDYEYTQNLKKPCNLLAESPLNSSNMSETKNVDHFINIEGDKWYQQKPGNTSEKDVQMSKQNKGGLGWKLSHSCFCNLIVTSLLNLFPILSAFKNYSLPGDLLNDLVAGLTVAFLQIPQGMAYGMLAGVEPIYGLYVSFVPVLIMACLSKSYHVSYGTFAMISMLLVGATDSVKLIFRQRLAIQAAMVKPLNVQNGTELTSLVVTDNHQPVDPSQQLLKNLILSQPSTFNSITEDGLGHSNLTKAEGAIAFLWPLLDPVSFIMPTNIEILTTVCLLVGAIQVGMALLRLGILSLMFSDQLVSSFTVGSACLVVTSQLGPVLDIDLPASPDRILKICYTWWAVATQLYEGFNMHTALLSFCSILFLFIIKELIEPALRRSCKSITYLPSELILMSFLIVASWYWKFEQDYSIKVIGAVPTGLPEPKMPRLDIAPLVISESITIALVSFALNISLVQIYAKRFNYTTNSNQELFALGTSNVVSSFFSCFPCASSISRSSVQSGLNVKSPLCSLLSCLMVVSIICYFAPILYHLPRSTLSCIIIVALKGILVKFKDFHEYWCSSKLDAFVWIVTFSTVISLGITYGLAVGIMLSLSVTLFRSCNRIVE